MRVRIRKTSLNELKRLDAARRCEEAYHLENATVRHWMDSHGLSSRVARLLVNDGFHNLASLRSGKWMLIPRCGEKMRLEIFNMLGRVEDERRE
jgi:hypothetical protein